ncbi:MAG: 16S rRNA (cytosine(967)-C(5))-methyltransferase RsmB [Eubacteriales bacterium]|nr:16S rRNA (cytosine(967)-C(5))-methyltransferase RsmB [Eubacteriales bacterium]
MAETRKTAREAAARALFSIQEDGAWSAQAIQRFAGGLERRDAALATALVGGVLQNQAMCDFYLSHYSKLRLKKIQPRILLLLRLAIVQIVWMDRIPDSAAVNESVRLAKLLCHADSRTTGYMNGVLRAISRGKDALPKPNCATKEEFYSLFYSTPRWLTAALIEQMGERETRKLLEANNQPAPTVLRVNQRRADTESVLRELREQGMEAEKHETIPHCLVVKGTGSIADLPCFAEGRVTVQDGASQMSVYALDPKPGSMVLDCCAAPGGKSFFLSERMNHTGTVYSCDIFAHKLKKIQEGAQRLGCSNITTFLQDAAVFRPEWEGKADYVLCDVPCSGLGIIRKKPEIRYKDPRELEQLPEIQRSILNNCSRYVRPGGTLVYSTCTILRRENQEVVDAFLAAHPEYALCAFSLPVCGRCEEGHITLFPHIHGTDGFFVAKFQKMD